MMTATKTKPLPASKLTPPPPHNYLPPSQKSLIWSKSIDFLIFIFLNFTKRLLPRNK